MNYSLGNMLNGGESLNADGLSLDLQFATDKTLTARKGPTPTFTRASTATFVGSDGLIQSAAINAARFDHDPITLACRGLLIEESRTNAMPRSQDFSNVAWTKTNSTVSGTLYTDPSGTSTANELVEDILLATHTCQQSAGTATIGTTYTFSVFVKRKDTSNQFLLIGASGLVSASFISVNLTNGVTATGIGSPAAPINVSSTAYPNGWYRVQFSVVATSAAAITLDIRLSRDGTWANRSYLGDGVQSSLIWGAQVEAGAFPTSYIPTTTASVVRSADVCSITGSDFTGFYNASAGTAVIRSSFRTNNVGRPFSFNNGSTTNNFEVFNGTQLTATITSGGTAQYAGAPNTTMLEFNTFALAAEASSAMAATNGTLATAGGGLMPVGIDRLNIGNRADGARILNGHIASLRYFRKRLPNAKLQTLTT